MDLSPLLSSAASNDFRWVVDKNQDITYLSKDQINKDHTSNFFFTLKKIRDYLAEKELFTEYPTGDLDIQGERYQLKKLKEKIQEHTKAYKEKHGPLYRFFAAVFGEIKYQFRNGFAAWGKEVRDHLNLNFFGRGTYKLNNSYQDVTNEIVHLLDQRMQNFDRKVVSIEGDKRAAFNKPIYLVVPTDVKGLKLTKENLPKIFQIINETTINRPYQYPTPWQKSYTHEGQTVYKPNHNGTHSGRQIRYLEAQMDLILQKGKESDKKIITNLTEEEKLNFYLAMYCFRAGRVDESSFDYSDPDDYYNRCKTVYNEYAKLFGVSEQDREWMAKVFQNSHPVEKYRDLESDKVPKNRLISEMLGLAHLMDLVRCHPKKRFDPDSKVLVSQAVARMVDDSNQSKVKLYSDQLIQLAKECCLATGSRVIYDYDLLYRGEQFVKCSQDAKACMDAINEVPIPEWK